MTRYGAVLGIRPEHIAEYKRVHAAVWPEVLKQIRLCQITNYTIFLREPENLLFSYYEYTGTDHDADMARMAADPKTQEWWALCGPMQRRLDPANVQPGIFLSRRRSPRPSTIGRISMMVDGSGTCAVAKSQPTTSSATNSAAL